MHIRFTNHAQFRINERKIDLAHIEAALKEKGGIDSFVGTYIAKRTFGQKTIEVIYKKKGKEIIVITAYYL